MSNKTAWLWEALQSWGLRDVFRPGRSRTTSARALEVYWTPRPKARILVGVVTQRNGTYEFSYDPQFCRRDDAFAVIPAFRELGETYTSERLWPFFTVRLPPLDRDDAKKLLADHAIDPEDPDDRLRLVEALAGRSPVSPFEFSLAGS
jgi:hypothetical protein